MEKSNKFFGGYGIPNGQGQREHCFMEVDPKFIGVSIDEILKMIKKNTKEHKNWWKTKKHEWSSSFTQLPS
jgi:hypothetical protein